MVKSWNIIQSTIGISGDDKMCLKCIGEQTDELNEKGKKNNLAYFLP